MSIIRSAAAPQRSTTSVTLLAGMLAVPLAVYTGTETTSVVRREFLGGNPDIPVGRVSVRRDTNEPVDMADVTRMAQSSNGTWVTLDDDEIASVAGPSGGCEVIEFVPVDKADRYLTDGLYQLRPKTDKRGGAATSAAYGLLLAGMAQRKVHALVQVTMRGTPRYALLTSGGDLLTIATADSIRQRRDLPSVQPSTAELDMVCQLIDAIGVGAPTLVDDVSVKVQQYVDGKAATGGVTQSGAALPPGPAPIDLAAVLQASIDAAKAAKEPSKVARKRIGKVA